MKTAVVTGVTSGIGKAITNVLKDSGWTVIGLSRKQLDLNMPHDIRSYIDDTIKDPRPIDALIHVAGIWHNHREVYANRDLEDFSPEQIVETMNVGITSFMVLAAALLPKIAKTGTVIGISGTFSDGATGWLPYYTSKRALEDFLIGLAQDYPHGPRVYGISPADTATPAYKKFYPESADQAQPPHIVAELCLELFQGDKRPKSGSIIEIRNGKVRPGYHR